MTILHDITFIIGGVYNIVTVCMHVVSLYTYACDLGHI